jgi:hypothetical protein
MFSTTSRLVTLFQHSVAIAEGDPTNIKDITSIETTTPDEALGKACEFLEQHKPFEAIGIASFGPVDLNKKSKTYADQVVNYPRASISRNAYFFPFRYGFVTTTPKPHWGNADVVSHFKKFGVPIGFDTDVNAPAVTEAALGNHGYETSISRYKPCSMITRQRQSCRSYNFKPIRSNDMAALTSSRWLTSRSVRVSVLGLSSTAPLSMVSCTWRAATFLCRSMLYHNFLICWSMISLGQPLGNGTYRKIIIASVTPPLYVC